MSLPQLRGQALPGHRGPADASSAWCGRRRPSARASWLRTGSPAAGGGDPGAGGIEPLAKRSGACAMRRRGSRCYDAPGQRGSPSPSRVRTIGALTATRNTQPSGSPGPVPARSDQAPTGASQRARDGLSRTPRASRGMGPGYETPAAVTAATAKTPLQITCPRRSPGAAAFTAKTPGNGLEITAATCADTRRVKLLSVTNDLYGPSPLGRLSSRLSSPGCCVGWDTTLAAVTRFCDGR